MQKTTSQILTEAREIHKERGYHKGGFIADTGQEVCMMGALRLATGAIVHKCGNCPCGAFNLYTIAGEDENLFQESNSALTDALFGLPERYNSVPGFNDAPNTTPEDIDLLWKQAIYAAEEQETGQV